MYCLQISCFKLCEYKALFTIGARALNKTLRSEFFDSHELSHTLHELSHSLHAFLWLHHVSSKYWTCTLFRRDRMRSKSLQCHARTLVRQFYNVLCTRKSNARFLKIIRQNYSCLSALVRLWLNGSHVILKHFTTIAIFIGFSFHALPLVNTGYRVIYGFGSS